MRAIAPMTQEALWPGDEFARRHPEIAVSRYLVPHFEVSPNLPASDEFRRNEGEQIRSHFLRLVSEERPDVVFMVRETFAWHVPDFAEALNLPCVLRIAGGRTIGALNGSYLLVRFLIRRRRGRGTPCTSHSASCRSAAMVRQFRAITSGKGAP